MDIPRIRLIRDQGEEDGLWRVEQIAGRVNGDIPDDDTPEERHDADKLIAAEGLVDLHNTIEAAAELAHRVISIRDLSANGGAFRGDRWAWMRRYNHITIIGYIVEGSQKMCADCFAASLQGRKAPQYEEIIRHGVRQRDVRGSFRCDVCKKEQADTRPLATCPTCRHYGGLHFKNMEAWGGLDFKGLPLNYQTPTQKENAEYGRRYYRDVTTSATRGRRTTRRGRRGGPRGSTEDGGL